MTPLWKPPRTKRLTLKHDEAVSTFAFNCNLRRYTVEVVCAWVEGKVGGGAG